VEEVVAGLSASAKAAGYQLDRLLSTPPTVAASLGGGGSTAAVAEELPAEGVAPGKEIMQGDGEGGRRR
jgi:hypothetical protein